MRVFGKLPASRDFVGLHGQESAVVRWLQRGHELAGGESISEPVYFVAQFAGQPNLLCGVLVPSEDGVGRRFPLIAFDNVPADLARASRGFVPSALQPFLDALVETLFNLRSASYAELEQGLQAIARPDPLLVPIAAERCRTACLAELTSSFVTRVYGSRQHGQLAYALQAIQLACEAPRTRSTAAPLALDCPIVIDLDLHFWAALTHLRMKSGATSPGLFWTEQSPRLLLTLAEAEPDLFVHLSSPRASHALWPLQTERVEALARAEQELPPAVRDVIERDGTLAELLECFA